MNAGPAPAPAVTAELEGRVRSRLHQLCPQFIPAGAFSCTETSILLAGRIGGIGALAKHPIDTRPFWQARARHEITVYTILATAGTPPVPLPQLIAADPRLPLTVMTLVPGTQLGPDRYPVLPLPAAQLDWLLDTLHQLHQWDAPALKRIPPDTDYATQYAILPADLFSPGELERHASAASALTRELGTQLEHGDAHPGNAMAAPHAPHAPLALIDLEFLAPRLPGYDLAMLWTVTGPSPALRSRITRRIGTDPRRQTAFWLNAILVLGREILSHRRSAPTTMHRDRLARLLRDLAETRARLNGHAPPLPAPEGT